MPINGLDRPELGTGNETPFGLAIGRREEHIRGHRHDESLGFDAAQCGAQVAPERSLLPTPNSEEALFSVRHVCEIHTHIRKSRRWFSVQRSHRGVTGTISLEIPGQASARPTSSAIDCSLDWCARRTCRSRSPARCAVSELEKMAAELRQKSLDPQRAQRRNSLSDIDT